MIYTPEEINLITLSSFDELTYIQIKTLLSDLTSATPNFVKYKESLIKSLSGGVYNKVKTNFYDEAYRKSFLDGLEKSGIECVTYFSKNYPQNLKRIDTPPAVLYCKGNLELLNTECFAVVGSRVTVANSLKHCKKIAAELTQHFTVVSGLADGADSAALEGALESGRVISVLAFGFSHCYPAMNKPLLKKVVKNGLAVSEYPPQVTPKRHYFPIRNRIIAALSKGVLVVSAGKKSGALITAEYAAEYGKDLFAFPYNVGVSSGEGCNNLIKYGAKLTENTLDIFEEFGLSFKPQAGEKLSKEEEKLLSLIRESGEAFVSDLAKKLGTLPFRLIPTISKLEIKGLIVSLGGNRYAAL